MDIGNFNSSNDLKELGNKLYSLTNPDMMISSIDTSFLRSPIVFSVFVFVFLFLIYVIYWLRVIISKIELTTLIILTLSNVGLIILISILIKEFGKLYLLGGWTIYSPLSTIPNEFENNQNFFGSINSIFIVFQSGLLVTLLVLGFYMGKKLEKSKK